MRWSYVIEWRIEATGKGERETGRTVNGGGFAQRKEVDRSAFVVGGDSIIVMQSVWSIWGGAGGVFGGVWCALDIVKRTIILIHIGKQLLL